MRRTLCAVFLGMAGALGVGGCAFFHGDPNDFERGSGNVGVLQPQLRPPAEPTRIARPVLPLSGEAP